MTTKLRCVSDRYSQDPCEFDSVDEFLEMCQECFGVKPELTRGSDYDGTVVYRDNEPFRHIVLIEENS